MIGQIQDFQRQAMEKVGSRTPQGVGGEVGVLRHLFLRLGVG